MLFPGLPSVRMSWPSPKTLVVRFDASSCWVFLDSDALPEVGKGPLSDLLGSDTSTETIESSPAC
jgi:hypothetical protein